MRPASAQLGIALLWKGTNFVQLIAFMFSSTLGGVVLILGRQKIAVYAFIDFVPLGSCSSLHVL